MIFNSIRWRVQIWHGLILIAVLLGFGFTAYRVALDNQMRRVDQELERQMMSLIRPLPRPEEGPPQRPDWRGGSRDFAERLRRQVQRGELPEFSRTNGYYYVLWFRDGSVAARSLFAPDSVPMPKIAWPAKPSELRAEPGLANPPPEGRDEPPPPPSARTRGDEREFFRFLPGGVGLLVGCSLVPDIAAMHRLAAWLATAGATVLLLGLVGGWWLASRAIRPIEDISITAGKIAGGDLSQRIDVADTESELGKLAGVLNSTFVRLETAFKQQTQFTSDASHELRTPVSVILTQTQTSLSRERPASEYRQALEACERAAQRMRKLVESLLELARLDAIQQPLGQEAIDLARIARDCIEFVGPLAAQRGIRLQGELDSAVCRGDAERLAQVITNLLTNAIHFNRDNGEVRVSTRVRNSIATLTVADTGEGIATDDLPHVFERFYRADKSRSGIQGRTGLGLAICKAIVEAHRGTIVAASQQGAGSTFTVQLPTLHA